MQRKISILMVLLSLMLALPVGGKQTVGLFLNKEGSYKGYTLFSPIFYYITYLIDNDGMIVHSWESDYKPGLMAYLTQDGCLYRSIQAGTTSRFEAFGGGVEKLDWDGNVLWRYLYSSDEYRQHHDFCVMPSGNVLLIAWEHKDTLEAVTAGRDPHYLHIDGVWPDHIVEVEPEGASGGNIVWEWHAWDHLIQEYDSSKSNYAVVSDHPELIDINYPGFKGGVDWTHLNSVVYNADLDQVMLSSREFSEVWVIDHSTTTEEARGHSGGKYGMGGDLLYRWGNPAAYGYGTGADQTLTEQHDAHWIGSGLPGEGNILVFNNGNLTADEFVLPVDAEGHYTGGLPWGPEAPIWSYTFFDYYVCYILSGVDRLPNGNTLICYGPSGIFSEVTPTGEEVWRYVNSVTDMGPVAQGEEVRKIPPLNGVYKVRRYPFDYPAFTDKDLTPKGPVELPGVVENEERKVTDMYIKTCIPGERMTIGYTLSRPGHVQIMLYNPAGRNVRTLVNTLVPAGNHEATWDRRDKAGRLVSSGVYFCTLQSGGERVTRKVLVFD